MAIEVRKLQLDLIDTFLVAPKAGVVTAVYKDVGEHVRAGEPVLRVEGADRLLIVGLLTLRQAIRLGASVEIETTDLFEAGDRLKFPGRVVSIRGHDADNDVWDVIIDASNTADLPINYHFDRDNTLVNIL